MIGLHLFEPIDSREDKLAKEFGELITALDADAQKRIDEEDIRFALSSPNVTFAARP